jgi:L-iditol 2-dehydrogenase
LSEKVLRSRRFDRRAIDKEGQAAQIGVQTMLVAKVYDFGDIRIETAERPKPGPGDILIRTRACGICSSDFLPWYIRRKAPLVFGHEPVGVVEEAGKEVKAFRPGERVFVHHHAPCWNCALCRRGEYVQCATWRASKLEPGGMAEYFLAAPVNQRDTLRLPNHLSDLDGVLIEPVACAVKALRRARLKPGETVLVMGLGVMGMINCAIARHFGAGRVIGADLFPQRAVRAKQFGADIGLVVSADNLIEQVSEATNGAMADAVVVGPGTVEALRAGIAAAGKGATVVQFTPGAPGDVLQLSPYELYFNETRIVPSYSCGPDDTRQALQLIETGVVRASQLVTHQFALAEAAQAYLSAQKPEALKVVVTFDGAKASYDSETATQTGSRVG